MGLEQNVLLIFRMYLKPTQQQFWDWLDSFRHKDDKIPVVDIEGIDELLQSKADKAVLDNHLTDSNAHSNEFDEKLDVTAMQEHLNDENAHAALFDEKVDKVPGKQLSTEDYTTEDKNTLESLNASFGTKEDKINKISTIIGNETNETLYPNAKAVYDSDVYTID